MEPTMPAGYIPPSGLVVRCVAFPRGGQWQAFSLEFGLAAQADSFGEARRKLHNMIGEYIFDALAGEDREHAAELMLRRATWKVYACYYIARIEHAVRASMNTQIFCEFWSPPKTADC